MIVIDVDNVDNDFDGIPIPSAEVIPGLSGQVVQRGLLSVEGGLLH